MPTKRYTRAEAQALAKRLGTTYLLSEDGCFWLFTSATEVVRTEAVARG